MKRNASRIFSWVLVCAMLLVQLLVPMPLQAQAATTVRPADTDIQNGTTLHCWNWSYANILEQLPTIAAQGFTAIQVSPIQKAKQPTMGSPVNDWWTFYQPAEFAIDNTGVNAMGTKAEFMNLCETAHEYGIYVIVDVVANHMAADYNYSRSPAILEDIRNDDSCWHNKNSNIYNYSSRENITQYDLDSVLDLNTGSKKVQNYVLEYLKELIDAGADGFRFDAVKHIETPDDHSSIASDFWPTVIYGAEDYATSKGLDLYCYGELLDHPDDVGGVPDSAYSKYYSITDNVWGNNVRDSVVAGGNASGFSSSYHKNVSADQLVLWAESHDTYAGGNSGSVSEANINKTWALVAARADAMGLYLTRTTGFTPPNALGQAYYSGWNQTEVAAVNKFHKAFVGQSEYLANSGNIAYVERGTSGVVLVNVGGNSTNVNVPAHQMARGTYVDQITGNRFTVSGGKISGSIGTTGIAVVYNVASCSHSSHNIAGLCSNCGASVSHSYSGGVCSCGKTQPVTSGCTHPEHRYNGVCRDCGTTVGHSYVSGTCSVCGVAQPVDTFDYYLTGYINGTNVNEISDTYKFQNGQLTFYSSVDAYVSIRTYNGICYQNSASEQYNDTVTLRNASMSGDNSQMRVPGGQTVTLRLSSNYNGTYTLSYAQGGGETIDTTTRTVYFDNSSTNWSVVNAYSWTAAGTACTGTWPGSTMTHVEGNIYKIQVSTSAANIIFNDGTNQSDDLNIPTDGKNLYNGSSWSTYTPAEQETKTVYVDIAGSGWSKVNVYTWNANGDCTGGWPGSAMSLVSGTVYSYEVPTNAVNIIFNDGTSQTDDLTVPTDGKNLYTYATSSWSTYATACDHSWSYGRCTLCGAVCDHTWANGVCTNCGSNCGHKWSNGACLVCDLVCQHPQWVDGCCSTCSTVCSHNYVNNVCTVCGGTYNPTDDLTVYFDATGSGWSNAYVYTWNTSGDCTGSWPGTAMTSLGNNLYSYEVPSNAVNIIFNAGNGQPQTDDLTIPTDGKNLYTYSTSSWSTYTAQCSHSYTAKVTTAAACETAGVKTYTCTKCGDSYTEAIPATGHSYTGKVTTAATCTANGVKTYTCSNCGVSYTESIPATGHTFVNGKCTGCGIADDVCIHSYTSVTTQGTCTVPGTVTYTCTLCGYSYTETTYLWSHNYVNGTCTMCGGADPNYVIPEETLYLVGYINGANYGCEEDHENMGEYKFVDGKLVATFQQDSYVFLKAEGNAAWYMSYTYSSGSRCNFYNTADHQVSEKMLVPGGVELTFYLSVESNGSYLLSYTTPSMVCPHESHNIDGICNGCGKQVAHIYKNGVCDCGAVEQVTEPVEYFLFGYINGANYACEEDAENMGEYKFVDGKVTATFTQDSYVAVKTTGNADWFMTNGYVGDVGVARLYNTTTLGNPDKLYVPGGVQVTFTLVVNHDNTLTLSYTETAPTVVPTITPKFPTVTFEDVITLNVFFSAENIQDVVEMGLITYKNSVSEWNINNAEYVIPGYTWDETQQFYAARTQGIPAKDMGDDLYFSVYAKLADGTYTYTKLVSYSAAKYAYGQLGDPSMSKLVVAMLNYGAAAQTYFGYKTDSLMNADLTAAQKASIETYRADMMAGISTPSAAKAANFTRTATGFTNRYPTITFDGAFCIDYYAIPNQTVSGDLTLYYWDQTDYDAASVLTTANATGALKMVGSDGTYKTSVEGIAAKDLDKGIYVAFVYSDGTTTYCSGILGYSIGVYCVGLAAGNDAMAPFAQATAVYGYYAKQMFN